MATATSNITTLDSARLARTSNLPQLDGIEPGIRALVDAVNETGLVQTFTSCEGHYGVRAPPGDFTDRERACVRFFLGDDTSEDDLQHFFGKVLADYERHEVAEASFCIGKRFESGLDGSDSTEAYYEFQVRPRNRNASDAEKRRITDHALAVITACVWRATDRDGFDVVASVCALLGKQATELVLLAS